MSSPMMTPEPGDEPLISSGEIESTSRSCLAIMILIVIMLLMLCAFFGWVYLT